jgi:ribose transport system permease protein
MSETETTLPAPVETAPPTVTAVAHAKLPPLSRALLFVSKYGTLIALAGLLVGFSAASPNVFPTVSNLVNVLNQVSLTAIIACGLTMAVIAGDFDLSIGYHASFAGVFVTGLISKQHMGLVPAVLATLALGAAIGLVNGLLVTKARINAIIATLGVGTLLVGFAYGYSQGVPFSTGLPDSFLEFGSGKLWHVPHNIFAMAIVGALLWIVVNKTDFGHSMQAVGGNSEAARLSGIRTDRVKMIAFVICGLAAALTGVLLASLVGSGTIGAGDSYLLSAFAAVYLGSATMHDGEFHIIGTIVGVLIIGVGFNGLSIFGLSTFYQYLFNGGVLILAVGLSSVARRYATR